MAKADATRKKQSAPAAISVYNQNKESVIQLNQGNGAAPARMALRLLGDKTPAETRHKQIAFKAWQIWREEGCPEGREILHWLQAERELGLK
jgi:hypothetical protein